MFKQKCMTCSLKIDSYNFGVLLFSVAVGSSLPDDTFIFIDSSICCGKVILNDIDGITTRGISTGIKKIHIYYRLRFKKQSINVVHSSKLFFVNKTA